jgi:hypothetical protein
MVDVMQMHPFSVLDHSTESNRRMIASAEHDERHRARLMVCADLCARALDDLVPFLKQRELPDATWRPVDLANVLQDQLTKIEAEQKRQRKGIFTLD